MKGRGITHQSQKMGTGRGRPYVFGVAQSSSSAVSQTCSLLAVCRVRAQLRRAWSALGRLPSATRRYSRQNVYATFTLHVLTCLAVALLLTSSAAHAQTGIILTQAPHTPATSAPKSSLDVLYPPGTRLILVKPPFAADHARALSEGLASAGSPVMSYDGQRVVFAGKSAAERDWQIYEARLEGGRPHALTSVTGGAMHPALLPDGSPVFASPVPISQGQTPMPQIYVQSHGGQPRRLTFTATGATEPVMMPDGRILFISAQPGVERKPNSGTALYTINNDGTEITAFGCQHDNPALLRNPSLLQDRRVAFLVSATSEDLLVTTSECVSMARPFLSRAALFPNNAQAHIRSVQPLGESNLLVCAEVPPGTPHSRCAWACFRVSPGAASLGAPLLIDPAWDSLEAIQAAAPARPMGRLSNMDPAKRTGQILCLDVNDTTIRQGEQEPAKAVRVRVTTATTPASLRVLGEVVVQEDGSFMAEVPADIPLGFEALDENGNVVRREPPTMWVRAGENRSCVGCHAAHNRAPHNHRPQAVRVPVPRLRESQESTQPKLAHVAP